MAIIPLSFGLGGGGGSDEVTATRSQVLAGYTAITSDSNDQPAEGTIPTKGGQTYYPTLSNQSINSGQYLGGVQVINKITPSNITAANIKAGIRVKVNNGNTDIVDVTGTYSTPSSGQNPVTADKMLLGYSGFVNGGAEVQGNIPSKAAETYNVSDSDRTIDSSQYLDGNQVIKGVTTANISAGNIKKDVLVQVGDSNSAGRIKNVTGTYTTPSSGQSAVTAAKMLTGYSGFVNGGSEIKGSMAEKAGTTQTATVDRSGSDIRMKVPADGHYSTVSYLKAAGSTFGNAAAANVLSGKTFTSSNGLAISGNMSSKAAATYYAGTDDQTIASGQYLSGAQIIKKLTQSNLIAANIVRGKTITINNGQSNVFSATGSNSNLRFLSGSVTVNTAKTITYQDTGSRTMYAATVNPGFTPLYLVCFETYSMHRIDLSTSGNNGQGNVAFSNALDWIWTYPQASSSSVTILGRYSGSSVSYWILGY